MKRGTTDHFTEPCTILKHFSVNSCDCCYLYCILAGEKSLPFIGILWTKDTANIWCVTPLVGCKSIPITLIGEIQIQKDDAFSSQAFLTRTYLLGKVIWSMEEHAIIYYTDNPYCFPWGILEKHVIQHPLCSRVRGISGSSWNKSWVLITDPILTPLDFSFLFRFPSFPVTLSWA